MPIYTLLSGETLDYPEPRPEVADFLARAHAAAADPSVTTAGMIELVYGPENPIHRLEKNRSPGTA